MTEYEVQDGKLLLTVEGMDKVWALRSHLTIPLEDITGVRADPEAGTAASELRSGVKLGGSRILGLLEAGTFLGAEGMVFWDVHRPGHSIRISLQHEHYKELVVDVADPEAAVSEIQQALRSAGG